MTCRWKSVGGIYQGSFKGDDGVATGGVAPVMMM